MALAMPFARYPWPSIESLQGQPTVGGLMALCEENYAALIRLIPGLRGMHGPHRARSQGEIDLFLDIVDQAPYTTTVRLTYRFSERCAPGRMQTEPDALLRAYHDARQVEVLGLSPTALPPLSDMDEPILLDKWRINLFLGKWLQYCAQQGYCFQTTDLARDYPDGAIAAARLIDAACP